MAVAEIISHVALVQEVMRAVMKPDVHYGVIPGTDKNTLLKQGAEVLCMAFRVADSYQVEDLSADGSVRYRVTCIGTHQTTGIVLGSGMGEASSGEAKYKWIKAYQEEWDATPEHLRRKKYGWDKQKRQKYEVLQVRTEPADLANTILKMANKRAKIAMTINVTACGDMFGQDLEDMEETLRDHLTRHGEDSQEEGPQGGKGEAGKLPAYPDEKIAANLPEWKKAIKDGKAKGVDQIVAFLKSKNSLTAEQEKRIRDECAKPASKAASSDAPAMTAAEVLEKLNDAKTIEELDEAASLISALPEAARAIPNTRYDELHAKFNSQE